MQLQLQSQLARELFDRLQHGDYDLIVAPLPPEPVPGLIGRELFEHRVFIVADQSHPLQSRSSLRLADLEGQEWMLPPKRILLRREIDRAFQAQGLPLPIDGAASEVSPGARPRAGSS